MGVAVPREQALSPGGYVYYSSYDPYYYSYGSPYYGYYPYGDPFWFSYGLFEYGDAYAYRGQRPLVEGRFGSVRLKVRPKEAEVYVDGYFVGRVSDFDGTLQHLDLEPGAHHVEIRAPGFESITFDVRTVVGRTITYSGDMEPVKK
jgi:hypothetical protein